MFLVSCILYIYDFIQQIVHEQYIAISCINHVYDLCIKVVESVCVLHRVVSSMKGDDVGAVCVLHRVVSGMKGDDVELSVCYTEW